MNGTVDTSPRGQRNISGAMASRGFTLVEVLVSVLVLSLGILGLIALESLSLKNNASAYQRSQATLLAYDLTDRIRANVDGVNAYTGSATHHACTYCDATEIAQNDLFEWGARLSEVLPDATHNVNFDGTEVTISISWQDNRQLKDATASEKGVTFETTFRP